MAERGIKPDYTVGKITLVSGSVNFTATGASLESANIQGGDTVMTEGGSVLIIDEITGQNSGTLIFPCPPDEAGVDFPIRIRFQPDGSRIQGAARDLIARWGQTGNVDAFAALAGYVNAVPVFTGAGTMKLVSLDDIGIDDPNGNLAQLAAIAKKSNQFLIMGSDGSVTLKPISEMTDAIENNRLAIVANTNAIVANTNAIDSLEQSKFNKPSGTTSQYLQGDGTADSKTNLPISTAMQAALNSKFATTGGDLTGGINIRSNADSAVRFFNGSAGNYGYTLFFESSNGTSDNGLRVVHSNNGLISTLSPSGNLSISGTISKAGGTFDIDHPKDPFNKNLRHSFVESTECLNLYRGLVSLQNGQMNIDIDAAFEMTDGTFEALNADVMVTSLQNQNGFDRVCVEGDPSTGKFTIICENTESEASVAWMITGRRKDAFVLHMDENCERGTGRFIPEYDKEDA